MAGINIRIVVDEDTYTLLQREQDNYYVVNQRKISLADVFKHYFDEGYNNATEEADTGLRIISDGINDGKPESVSQLTGDTGSQNNELLNSALIKINNKLAVLDLQEKKIASQENELLNKNQHFNSHNSRQDSERNQLATAEREISRLNIELSNTKHELEIHKMLNKDSGNKVEFREIQKSLDLIEKQTKKSIFDQIMPFVTPLLQILSTLLLNNKLNSKVNQGDLQKEVQNIFSKLDENEKKKINEIMQNTMSDIL
ncbi:MAG: hypothetical protein K9J13_05640 [Saprospiraceae bacterium]|nr:hypothetical protein [Saprospiraceae bacterium]